MFEANDLITITILTLFGQEICLKVVLGFRILSVHGFIIVIWLVSIFFLIRSKILLKSGKQRRGSVVILCKQNYIKVNSTSRQGKKKLNH